MLRFGKVTEIDHTKGKVRVSFEEDGIVSDWIPMAGSGSSRGKTYASLYKDDHVACVMDEHCEAGVVLGTVYDQSQSPVDGVEGGYNLTMDNGDQFKYDANTQKLTLKVKTTLYEQSANGFKLKSGTDSLGKCLADLIDQILLETHPVAGPNTGTPLNAAAYSAIKTRLQNFIT